MSAGIFKREIWSYAVLLLILFALAAVSVSQVLIHLHDLLIDPEQEFPVVAGLILLLTMGFMFLAGAFGLWTIQFVTEKEAQRRLIQLVDAMDHLQDGIVVVDRGGRITAMNASARRLIASPEGTTSLASAFPGLDKDARDKMLAAEDAVEIEESLACGAAPSRTLRFRSQPVGSFRVVMLSDVTAINLQRQHSLVKARLQILGELAKGVAHDFSSLLVDISGYAALLARVSPSAPEFSQAIKAIARNTDRGSALAQQILTLARGGTTGAPTDLVLEHARTASEDLAAILPPEWHVEFSGEGRFPVVALSGIQVEQIVMNLGLLVAEARRQPGTVSIVLSQPPADRQLSSAGTLLIHGATSIQDIMDRTTSPSQSTPSGVVQSVIRNIVEEAGGRMDAAAAADGIPYFRVWLPLGSSAAVSSPSALSPEQCVEVSSWRIMLACGGRPDLHRRLTQIGAKVQSVNDIVAALAFVEDEPLLDAMVLEHHLLRPETRGLLRAIRKLRPECGVVVLTEEGEEDLPPGVACASRHAPPDDILAMLVELRKGVRAGSRGHPAA